MPVRTPVLSNAFRQYARCLRGLQELFARGEDESSAADAIRDESDEFWLAMTSVERERAGGLSADLYSLNEPAQEPKDWNPQAREQIEEALAAKQLGDWDRSLRLLRRWAKYVDPAALSSLRGAIWGEFGDTQTAIAFLEHAAKTRPARGTYAALYLLNLSNSDSQAATAVATEWVADSETRPPAAIIAAAITILRTVTPVTANALAAVVEQSVQQLDGTDENARDDVAHRSAFAVLGALYAVAGRPADAFRTFDRGLSVYPDDELLLISRGSARGLYGALGVEDLRRAAVLAPEEFWVDYLLARHYLTANDAVQCCQHCERALGKVGPTAARTEVAQWLGITRLALGDPVAAREAFELALKFSPQDSRATENYARFLRFLETNQSPEWVTRSQAEVCADSLHASPTLLAA